MAPPACAAAPQPLPLQRGRARRGRSARSGVLRIADAAFALLCLASAPPCVASWSVLLLGGSGFRGHLTAESLLRAGHKVTVLSRGQAYWGTLERLKELGVTHWACNRTIEVDTARGALTDSSGLALCPQLTAGGEWSFDAVVDFSSRNLDQIRQAIRYLRERVGFYVFVSGQAVYDVSRNSTHGRQDVLESDSGRPGREVSPLIRFQLKEKSPRGDRLLECEEELLNQWNAGGFPYSVLRVGNVFGPKENSIRFWLLHVWLRVHIALTVPMHIDAQLAEQPISMTYTPDIAQAVHKLISKAKGETCCAEDVEGEAFNLASEEAPIQRTLYDHVAEPMGLNYVETTDMPHNTSIVLYPELARGPLCIDKALRVLRWAPTDLRKALRSVARFYDRVMLDEKRFKVERDTMYAKCKKMLGLEDGPRIVSWVRAYYDDRRKSELYDELDDEDEDEILLFRQPPEKRGKGARVPKTSGKATRHVAEGVASAAGEL